MAAQGVRVTLLERHPLASGGVKKFAGRGRCVEVHVPVKLPRALDYREAEGILSAIQRAVSPLLVVARGISDAERAQALGLRDDPESNAMWTFTFASLRDIVIRDVRGITVQATALKPAEVGNSPRPPKEQQLSLAEAFSHAQKRKEREEPSLDVKREPLECARMDEELRSFAFGLADAPSASLLRLSTMQWGGEFVGLWKEGCTEACARQNWQQVRGFLRCALWKLSEVEDLGDPRGEFQKLYDFVFSLTKQPITIQ
ncbi:unnamed protein product [Phytomonas sp. EM1]|nr:unnamed protein product [Phytomonas sp. EM1]|eukprot:CCW59908.1 unnamed protein product [Phytomonas sp. isolate EM1]